MTDDKTVEAVARALFKEEWGVSDFALTSLDSEYRESKHYWHSAARAAIKVLQEDMGWGPPLPLTKTYSSNLVMGQRIR